MKFKVGDRVKVIKCFYNDPNDKGLIGEIVQIDKRDNSISVQNERGRCWASKVKLLSPKKKSPKPKKVVKKKEHIHKWELHDEFKECFSDGFNRPCYKKYVFMCTNS